MRKVYVNCLLHKDCAYKEEVQFSLIGCYAFARDMCWSEVILYSTTFRNSYRMSWPRWWELKKVLMAGLGVGPLIWRCH